MGCRVLQTFATLGIHCDIYIWTQSRRGQPVVICILACSLGFHNLTFKCSFIYYIKSPNKASAALNLLAPLLAGFLHMVAQNVVTDRHTDLQITLAAYHAKG